MNIIKKIFDHEYKELERFKSIAEKVMALDFEMVNLSDADLRNKTDEFKQRLEKGETLEDVLVESFAVVRETAFRIIGEKPYFVQIVGGLALHYGNIAEMKTGEGKTLTSTMPAYLNALSGKGVHIITVNDYLATRDAEWMGSIYRFLGLTVGVNSRELSPQEKKEVYNSDITYSTNNELGFDYLRDNMVVKAEDRVQRKLSFVIIDEVDSVLIDEARTPLIISGGFLKSANLYIDADRFAKSLKEDNGYIYDEKTKAVSLDAVGIQKAEKHFNLDNLYDIKNSNLVHFINQALKANFAMKLDFDYVVQEEKIIIVDQFTGRLMHGRNYSDGLHQAIEAKENVPIGEETKTLATITFQNLFRMYEKISGMTGTAKTEEEEFREIYNMFVICIPTNVPVVRVDHGDLLFSTKDGKYKAIVEAIAEKYEKKQPVLVGTVAVETSELISSMLKKRGVPHEVLNAKNHSREAEIIAKAGALGSVTIATNMAGRGTDIKLPKEAKELGGLFVLGTERHESRRIDNQLRGRSGRQGDPGESQFCISFEDELMVRFGTERAKAMLEKVGFQGENSLRNPMFSKMVESAQKKVEGNNFDMRKNLLKFDDVANKHRAIIYEKRNEVLDSESIHETVLNMIMDHIDLIVGNHSDDGVITEFHLSELLEDVNTRLLKKNIDINDVRELSEDALIDFIYDRVIGEYEEKLTEVPNEIVNEFEKAIVLRVIDTYWMEHINTLSHLKEGISLRGYAQEDPARAYTKEGFILFESMLNNIDKDITSYLIKAQIRQNVERKKVVDNEVTNEDKTVVSKPKTVKKIGRNDLCDCGSGKKYKHCCGK